MVGTLEGDDTGRTRREQRRFERHLDRIRARRAEDAADRRTARIVARECLEELDLDGSRVHVAHRVHQTGGLALDALPEGYHHAYDQAGSGWSYTWPIPCPVWAIDQCIVGPRVQPLRYTQRSTTSSDHRMQIFDFRLRDESSRPLERTARGKSSARQSR